MKRRSAAKITCVFLIHVIFYLEGYADTHKEQAITSVEELSIPTQSPYSYSPWGIAPSHTSSYNINLWQKIIFEYGIKNVRGFHTGSVKNFNSLLDTGYRISGFLHWSPAKNPGSLPVKDLNGWQSYVKDTLAKFPQVTHWEIWNEPPNFTSDKSPESYAAIVESAYQTIKSINPDLQVGLAVKSVQLNYLARVLEHGARNKFDYITYHPYEYQGLLARGIDAPYMNITRQTRQLLRELNPDKINVPISFTEAGFYWPDHIGSMSARELQATVLVKTMIMAIAQNIQTIYWFEPLDTETLQLGLLKDKSTPRPALEAYRTLIQLLGDKPIYLGWNSPERGFLQFFFKRAEAIVMFEWGKSESPHRITINDDGTKVIDFISGKARKHNGSLAVRERPVIVTYPHGSPDAIHWIETALRNKDLTISLDGAPKSTKELVYLSPQIKQGLETISAPDKIIDDGEWVFDASKTPQVQLIIDPEFFNNINEDVILSIVVKAKNTSHHRPGFNLKFDDYTLTEYEPLENANKGWNIINDGEFTEKSWKIKNLSAVGSFGFQIQLDSDSTERAQYLIQSITISKVR